MSSMPSNFAAFQPSWPAAAIKGGVRLLRIAWSGIGWRLASLRPICRNARTVLAPGVTFSISCE
jgi:hypothetical protein